MDSKEKIKKESYFGENLNFWIGSIISPADSAVQEQLVSLQ